MSKKDPAKVKLFVLTTAEVLSHGSVEKSLLESVVGLVEAMYDILLNTNGGVSANDGWLPPLTEWEAMLKEAEKAARSRGEGGSEDFAGGDGVPDELYRIGLAIVEPTRIARTLREAGVPQEEWEPKRWNRYDFATTLTFSQGASQTARVDILRRAAGPLSAALDGTPADGSVPSPEAQPQHTSALLHNPLPPREQISTVSRRPDLRPGIGW